LQRSLETLGFLPDAARIAGVYGAEERSAIIAWQTQHGRAPTGLLGEADARSLEREAPETTPALTPPTKALGPREEIPLSPSGNVLLVPVRINGAITLPFILDSGAADVQIPADVAGTLRRAGTISEEDFIGSQVYVLADGSKLSGEQFKLRELKLGDHLVHNVVASTGPAKGDLLLGQSFLSRFGTWAIDNRRRVLILQSPDQDQRTIGSAQRSGG
jgi:peptidoglycan hydrolase-like protein with peptidoglycan-binding domain